MKFGYYIRGPLLYPQIRDLAIRVEGLGYDSIHVNDHLIGFDEKQDKKEPYLEAIMLMTALAVETKKLKLGHTVICNSFRNPAYLAKCISTLDHISEGRALLWLGAGWYEEEYKAYGYPFPSPKERVDQLEESLTIYKKLFTEDVTDFSGKFWKLERNRNFPKPIQKPYPQIVLGSSGKRMIDIACREADGINLPYVPLTELEEKIHYINKRLEHYNRNLDDFEISLFNTVTLVNSQESLDKLIEKINKRVPEEKRKSKEEILDNQFIGFLDDIKVKIEKVEEMGIRKMVIVVRKSEGITDPLGEFSRVFL
ncbi:MAG: LLM class flavin-dependent oxidoreductase [Candidatus Heimdallarchaeum endolithica]|uniref:LLM class flavin-dependent oxidoreductase n=1 Tax=Candidatus Heimdallarchaeum endolithica TaxID=2876572 RepID=A0A9Y1FQ54_9ARCH|nr:MAG: LLM class flavin-dependent oxidoreductase [Candidatus Heimdallarchaeum endolithica]